MKLVRSIWTGLLIFTTTMLTLTKSYQNGAFFRRKLTSHLSIVTNDINLLSEIKSALKCATSAGGAGPQNELTALGLSSDIVKSLQDKGITAPTPVQKSAIPALLRGESICLAASTGSGKTFAYTLPMMQRLSMHEQGILKADDGGFVPKYNRMPKRPRCLVLVPTRELARQVLGSVKHVGHFSKMSATAVLGGEQYSVQKKNLDRLVDIVVASPGRLLQHRTQGNVYLGHVTHVIIDEVDTMLTQGFGNDLRTILQSVLQKPRVVTPSVELAVEQLKEDFSKPPLQLIMASATVTKAVKALLTDIEGFSAANASSSKQNTAKSVSNFNSNLATGKSNASSTGSGLTIRLVEVDGLHRSLAGVAHQIEPVRPSADKKDALRDVLDRYRSSSFRTLIFCNTVSSCQSLQYYLNGMSFGSSSFGEAATVDHTGQQQFALSYHGDLNSREREYNLKSFRDGNAQYLVCTDIAARGLDIPEIDHVVMFDFPLNPIDYLHRAGRCGRAGREGLVTSLVSKRDQVLSRAIMTAISRNLPLDQLSSSRVDYEPGGRLYDLVTPSGSSAPGVARRRASSPVTERDFAVRPEHSSFFDESAGATTTKKANGGRMASVGKVKSSSSSTSRGIAERKSISVSKSSKVVAKSTNAPVVTFRSSQRSIVPPIRAAASRTRSSTSLSKGKGGVSSSKSARRGRGGSSSSTQSEEAIGGRRGRSSLSNRRGGPAGGAPRGATGAHTSRKSNGSDKRGASTKTSRTKPDRGGSTGEVSKTGDSKKTGSRSLSSTSFSSSTASRTLSRGGGESSTFRHGPTAANRRGRRMGLKVGAGDGDVVRERKKKM